MNDKQLRSKLIRLAHARPELRPALLPLLAPQGKQAASKTALRYKGPWASKLKDMFFDSLVSAIKSSVPWSMKDKVAPLTLWASAFYHAWVSKNPKLAIAAQKFARANGIPLLEEAEMDKRGLKEIEGYAKYADFENAAEMIGSLLRLGGLTMAQKFEPYIEEYLPVKEVKLSPSKQFMSWVTPAVQSLASDVWGELNDKNAAIYYAGALCEDVNWHGCPLPPGNPPDNPTSYSDVAQHLSWDAGAAAGFSYALLLLANASSAATAVKRAAIEQLIEG